MREVREELGRDMRIVRRLGCAVQYFYAHVDNQAHRMRATFLEAELDQDQPALREYDLLWPPLSQADALFHPRHAWAVRFAFRESR